MSEPSNGINGAKISTYLEHILDKVQHHELVCDKGDKNRDKPIDFVQPAELEDRIGSLAIGRESVSDDKLDAIVESVIRYSAKTSSPRFHNQVQFDCERRMIRHEVLDQLYTVLSYTTVLTSTASQEVGFPTHSIPTTTPSRSHLYSSSSRELCCAM